MQKHTIRREKYEQHQKTESKRETKNKPTAKTAVVRNNGNGAMFAKACKKNNKTVIVGNSNLTLSSANEQSED